MLIYTLAEAKFPFIDDTFWSLRSRFKNDGVPQLPQRGRTTAAAAAAADSASTSTSTSSRGYSAACCDFVACMLQVDPRARSTADELLQHEFIMQHIDAKKRDKLDSTVAVSYTHLTLPTIYSV